MQYGCMKSITSLQDKLHFLRETWISVRGEYGFDDQIAMVATFLSLSLSRSNTTW
jgi:hypothetical protein